MTQTLGTLSHSKHYYGDDYIMVGNGSKLNITHVGVKHI